MTRLDHSSPCAGAHELGYDSRVGMSRCAHCGRSAQTLTADPRAPVAGDYRVVCRGVGGDGVCPIGSSEPTPFRSAAVERYNAHQREAVARDGEPHDAEVIECGD